MRSTAVLDGNLFVRHDFKPTEQRNALVAENRQLLGHLASQLLLYDQILIPTKDYGMLPILAKWMGTESFFEALREGCIRFVHVDKMLSYIGNGGGVKAFSMGPGDRPFGRQQQATWGSQSDAIEIQLSDSDLGLTPRQRRLTAALVHRVSTAVNSEELDYEKHVTQETYADIDQTPAYRNWVIDITDNRGGSVDLTRLPGVDANQIQIPTRGDVQKPIELVLRIAEVNEEILLAGHCGQCDLLAPGGSGDLLRSKLRRAGIAEAQLAAFTGLLELAGVPDVGAAVAERVVDLKDVWRLRTSRASKDFRRWLREADAQDSEELKRAYVASLQDAPWVGSAPARVLRFLITTAASVLPGGLGVAVDAVDSFFVDRWLGGYSPQVHLDELKRILGQG